MDNNYTRVIPRDLFNESKLLKCMGRLSLLILDNNTPVPMSIEHNGEPFEVALLDEGALIISNLHVSIHDKIFTFKTTYNSKANYPLFLERDYCDYLVFDEQGNWSNEFVDFCEIMTDIIDCPSLG